MEDSVYVMCINNRIAGENENIECYGVYTSLDKALERMKKYIKDEITGSGWVLDEQYEEGDMMATIFWQKQENWNEYFEVIIFQKEIE